MPQPEKHFVTIGLIQSRVSTDPKLNLVRTVRMIRAAAGKGARVLCLQELFRTRYFPVDENQDVRHLAESIPGETTAALSVLAAELGIVVIVPVFEKSGDGQYFNSAAVIDADGSLLGAYRKVHIPHDPFFYEQSYFGSGDLGYPVFHSRYLALSVLICYDQWFPEAARAMALAGAEALFYPTAIGYLRGDPIPKRDWVNAWTTVQRGHAIANSIPVAAVNRVGREGEVEFFGSSFVCDAFGKVLKTAGPREEILIVDLDISRSARIREGWRFAKNRHPETYRILTAPPLADTPEALGFRMPAEWEKHDATWLAWPEDRITFPHRLVTVRETFLDIIEALASGERVNLAVRNSAVRARVRTALKRRNVDLTRIRFFVWGYADVWFRDYGPAFVTNAHSGKVSIVQWRFNAWGGKYKELLKDSHVPYYISERLGLDLFRPGIVLEGGAIDVNGRGTVLTTEQCLLNPNRNPRLTRRQMETFLREYLGAGHVIWLKSGIAGDDTDGHIDNLARFVGPDTVLCAFEDNRADENYASLKENYEILRRSTDQEGKPLNVVKLPMPPAKRDLVRGARKRLPSSYLNFYIANGVVLVPVFADRRDAAVLDILREVFPARRVVGLDCRDLVYGSGSLHCVTQQQPASTLR